MMTSKERKDELRDSMLVEIARGIEMLLNATALTKPMSGSEYSYQSGRVRGTRELFTKETSQ